MRATDSLELSKRVVQTCHFSLDRVGVFVGQPILKDTNKASLNDPFTKLE